MLNGNEKFHKQFIDKHFATIQNSINTLPNASKKEQLLGYVKNPTKANIESLQKEVYGDKAVGKADGKFGTDTLAVLQKWTGEVVAAAKTSEATKAADSKIDTESGTKTVADPASTAKVQSA